MAAERTESLGRKVREGVVVSNKAMRTVTVRVSRTFKHPIFEKTIQRWKKYYADLDLALLGLEKVEVGQTVRIEETRPLSKLKRWRVIAVMQK